MRTMSRFLAGTASLALAAGGAAPSPALAGAAPVSDHYAGRSGSQVADISLLGRRAAFGSATAESDLEAVGDQLHASATGLGSTLVAPATRSVARFNDANALGGARCAAPLVGDVLTRGGPNLPPEASTALPAVTVAPACADAAVTGDARAFTVTSAGGRTQVAVKLARTLGERVQAFATRLDPKIIATPVSELIGPATSTQEKATVSAVNGLLGSIVPGVALPDVEPRQTVGSLLDRMQSSDLVRVDLTGASARNAGDNGSYLSEALSQGGVIDVLPDFRGKGTGPLLRISVAESRAGVSVDRATAKATPVVHSTALRIQGELLRKLPLAGPSVLAGQANGIALAALMGGDLPVVGGLLGAGLPFDRLTTALGMESGPDFVEIGPGQGLSLFCEGTVSPLCSEMSVGAPIAPSTTPGGLTRAEASMATVHLFKGLDGLGSPTKLGTVLADPEVTKAIEPLARAAGLTLGEATGLPGIRFTMAGAVAEAGAARVMGADEVRAFSAAAAGAPPAATPAAPAPNLPHTGGLPYDPRAVPALLVTALGLLAVGRRTRRRS
jgi:hypothetical protein